MDKFTAPHDQTDKLINMMKQFLQLLPFLLLEAVVEAKLGDSKGNDKSYESHGGHTIRHHHRNHKHHYWGEKKVMRWIVEGVVVMCAIMLIYIYYKNNQKKQKQF